MSNDKPAIELKDVIHLYLGCEVMIEFSKCKLVGMERGKPVVENLGFPSWARFETVKVNDLGLIKPILRKLDSMTEGEKIGLCSIGWCALPILEVIETTEAGIIFKYESFEQERTGEQLFDELNPRQFYFLLKGGFDLFQLIENNLAIDKNANP